MEHHDDYQNEVAALTAIAGKLGRSPDGLRVWMRQVGPAPVQVDSVAQIG